MSSSKGRPLIVTDETVGGAGVGFWDAVRDRTAGVIDASERRGDAWADSLEDWPVGVIVDGDDRLVSKVVTTGRRRLGRERELHLEVIETGSFRAAAKSLKAGDAETVRRKLDNGSDWLGRSRTPLPLLRVTSSAEPAPLWGTTFGAGAWFKLAEIVHRGGGRVTESLRSAARSAVDAISSGDVSAWQIADARVAIDREPWSDKVGHLLASSLASSWLGVSMASRGAPGWIGDASVGSLPRMVAKGSVPGFGGGDADTFDRLHANWSAGFVVDGRLIDAGAPHAVEVAPAPPVSVVA